MENLLALTLADETPSQREGEGPSFHWRWLGRGVLELIPTARSELSLLLSTGIHGNETAPVEIVDLLLRALYSGEIALHCRLLVVLGNPPALAQNKRYLVSDINRMFGGRWSQFPQSDETARAQWLEQIVTSFFTDAGPSRWHLDLHTAIRASYHVRFGVLPQRNQPWEEDFLSWLGGCGAGSAGLPSVAGGDLHALYLRTLRRAGLHAGAGKSAAVWAKRSYALCPDASCAAGAAGGEGAGAHQPARRALSGCAADHPP